MKIANFIASLKQDRPVLLCKMEHAERYFVRPIFTSFVIYFLVFLAGFWYLCLLLTKLWRTGRRSWRQLTLKAKILTYITIFYLRRNTV